MCTHVFKRQVHLHPRSHHPLLTGCTHVIPRGGNNEQCWITSKPAATKWATNNMDSRGALLGNGGHVAALEDVGEAEEERERRGRAY